jgi:hypothetical protein
MRVIRKLLLGAVTMLAIAGSVQAQQVPLMFGMDPQQASQALGVPLNYIGGRPGEELFAALPNVKGATLSKRSDGLYLQFRRGRLAGWKGDWGTNRP